MKLTTLRVTHIDLLGHRHRCLLRNVTGIADAQRYVEQLWGEALALSMIWLKGD